MSFSINNWRKRFFIWLRIFFFVVFPIGVIWLFGMAAWDKFALKIQPDLFWDMLITIPIFFVFAGSLLSAFGAFFPFDEEDKI